MRKSGTIYLSKVPLLTDIQIAGMAEILRNTGYIILAAIVFPYFISNNAPSVTVVVYATIFMLVFWIISIIIVRNIET